MKRPRTLVPFGLLVVLGLIGWGLIEAGLALNFMPSLPLGVYCRADDSWAVGSLVSVCLEEHIARAARGQGILAAGSCPAEQCRC